MPVLDRLRVILTNEEIEIVEAVSIPQNQRCLLIDILRRKDKRLLPFKRLLRALLSDRVGQEWLANEIRMAYNRECMDAEFGRAATASLCVTANTFDSLQQYSQDNRYNQGHMITGGNFDRATFYQQIYNDGPETSNTSNNQNNQGRMVGGPVHGGIVVQGNYYASTHETRQVPSTSSSIPSQPSTEDWQKKLET
uniref:Uncharacterized protein n=1 Tax=Plectus sambesii TaxID=2011161 RepID=A0A914WIS0_9BILA